MKAKIVKNGSKKKKAPLPPGIVAYKGTKEEMAKLRKWLANEPDSLASAGPHVRFKQTVVRK